MSCAADRLQFCISYPNVMVTDSTQVISESVAVSAYVYSVIMVFVRP